MTPVRAVVAQVVSEPIRPEAVAAQLSAAGCGA